MIRFSSHASVPSSAQVTCNSIAPGFVRSNPASEAQWQAFGAEGQGRVLEATFMRRLGTPEVRLQSSPDLPDFAPSHPNLLPYPGHR